MNKLTIIDLGRASDVTESSAFGTAPEANGSGLRIYVY